MKQITSLKNPIIQQLVLLHESKHRNLKKMFLIEGEHLISIALFKKRLLTIYIDEKYLDKYDNLLKKCYNIEIIIVNSMIIKKISQQKTPQPIIGVCNIIKPVTYFNVANIILLDTIQDPGNLGNILRSVSAFNISEVYLSNESVDLYNHKVVNASQGAIFDTNVYYENFDQFLLKVKKENYMIYGTFLHETNSTNLSDIVFKKKNAFLFGNEGQGINKKYKDKIDTNILIATSTTVESLNLATSVAIVGYCLFTSNILK
ncbi:TrmH family RNA methyltransferase [Spiroplasma endosymbiont of Polydrusus pterygomalis]|uniref:TrmH family RNA methyltransferase n=1 Tax=Spiroplasma endosymbiont of Polydrusus pterygomalis TaxID=3139327 RepID=UPI003CCB5485